MNNPLALGDSLIVTVIGMLIVFFGLTVLIFLIKALVMATEGLGSRKAKPSAAPAPAAPRVAETPAVPADTEEEDSDELTAVITAAVACMMEEGSSFTVRHVRRIGNAPAWSKAGREEQIYSRI